MELHNERDVSIVLPTVTSDADGQRRRGWSGVIEVDAEERESGEWQEHKVKAAVSEIFMSQHTHQLESQSDTATERSISLTLTVHSVYPNYILPLGMDTLPPT